MCKTTMPPLLDVGPQHTAACWLYEQDRALIRRTIREWE